MIVVTGQDTIKINGRLIADVANGDVGVLDFPNDLTNTSRGKNGNAVIADNQKGGEGDFTLRILRGGADDKFLNSQLASQRANIVGTPLCSLELTKRLGDGLGNKTNDVYVGSGGTIKKIPSAKSNVEGDTEQGITIWSFHFADTERVLG